jgi:hypothetical protein
MQCQVDRAKGEKGFKMPLCAYCEPFGKRAPCKIPLCDACRTVPPLLPTGLAGLAPSTNDLEKVIEALKMPGIESGALCSSCVDGQALITPRTALLHTWKEALENAAGALNLAAAHLHLAVRLVSPPLQQQGGSSNDAAPPGLSEGHKSDAAASVEGMDTAAQMAKYTNVAAATVARVDAQAAQQQAAPVQAGHVVAPVHAVHTAPVQDAPVQGAHVAAPVQAVLAAPQEAAQVAAQAVRVQNAPVQAVPETTSDAASGSGIQRNSWEASGWTDWG